MPSDELSGRSRGRTRRRWIRRLALLAVLVTAGVWAVRELPARLLGAYLSRTLDARVAVERLRLDGWTSFAAEGVRGERFKTAPAVELVTFDEVMVEAGLRELLSGRTDRVVVRGMKAELGPGPFEWERRDPPLEIGELVLEPSELRIRSASGEVTEARFEGRFEDVGGDLSGRLDVTSPEVDLDVLEDLLASTAGLELPRALGGRLNAASGSFEMAAASMAAASMAADVKAEAGALSFEGRELTLSDLEARWSTDAEGRHELRLDAVEGSARVGERTLEMGEVGLTGTALTDDETLWRIELVPELAVVGEARVAVDWDRGDGRLEALEGKVTGVALELLAGRDDVRGDADFEVSTEGDRLTYGIRLRPRALETPSLALASEGATMVVEGDVPLDALSARPVRLAGPLELSLELPRVEGELDPSRPGHRPVPDVFPLRGSFRGELVDGRLDDAVLRGELRGTSSLSTSGAGRLEARGDLRWTGSELETGLEWSWREVDLVRAIELLRQVGWLPSEVMDYELAGQVEGRGRLRGRLADPRLEATLRGDGLTLQAPHWKLEDGSVDAELRWGPSGARPELRVVDASADLESELLTVPLSLQARAQIEPSFRAGTLSEAVLASPGLGSLTGGGRFELAGGVAFAGGIGVRDASVAAWARTLGLETGSIPLEGRLSAELEAELAAAGWALRGPARLESAGTSSADGSRAVAGLHVDWRVDASGGGGGATSLRATGSSRGILVLWGTFYRDLQDAVGSYEITASLPPRGTPQDLDWRVAASLDVPSGGVSKATLRPAGPRSPELAYTLEIDAPDLAAAQERFLGEFLGVYFENPSVGGRLRAVLHGEIGGPAEASGRPLSLAGNLHLESFDGTLGDQLAVTGLDLYLPLDLRFGTPAEEPPGGPAAGRARFESFAFRGLELPSTETGIRVQGDDLEIEKPLAFRILGGTVTLDRLGLRDLLRPEPYLASSLSFEDLQLERISSALELFPLDGTVAGSFPRFRLSARELKVEGDGEVAIFGGRVTLRDISGKNILSGFPTLTLSADFQDVDLLRLTRRLDFGEMKGILRGWISDCEFFRGVPVRCRARFETEEEPGVARTVDVKAINNLSVLGTGRKAGILDRGVWRFLDHYRYRRLGVELALQDNRLLLRGLERRGERELFVKGRFPFPIDVVNVQPGRTVSFDVLRRRLGSIDFSLARTSKGSGAKKAR